MTNLISNLMGDEEKLTESRRKKEKKDKINLK